MPHGGIVKWLYPVRVLLKATQCLSPMAAHIPVSRLFLTRHFNSPLGLREAPAKNHHLIGFSIDK